MAVSVAAKALLLLGFSLLLSSLNAHVPYSPPPPPATPPPHPSPPPPPPPSPPMFKKHLAVDGVVLCKNCKYLWRDTLADNTALRGAVVRIECNTKYGYSNTNGTTDQYGYFFITPNNIFSEEHDKCKVFLVSSNSATCTVPTNVRGGITGAILRRVKTLKPPAGSSIYAPTYELFSVGPLAYQPNKACW